MTENDNLVNDGSAVRRASRPIMTGEHCLVPEARYVNQVIFVKGRVAATMDHVVYNMSHVYLSLRRPYAPIICWCWVTAQSTNIVFQKKTKPLLNSPYFENRKIIKITRKSLRASEKYSTLWICENNVVGFLTVLRQSYKYKGLQMSRNQAEITWIGAYFNENRNKPSNNHYLHISRYSVTLSVKCWFALDNGLFLYITKPKTSYDLLTHVVVNQK